MKKMICIILIASLFDVSRTYINKCCPKGNVVEISSDQFNCVPKQLLLNNEKLETNESVNENNSGEFIGYNVFSDENSHWPFCENKSNIKFEIIEHTKKVKTSLICVDIMNKNYYSFNCEQKGLIKNDDEYVYKLKKCCNLNFSFDIFSRKCVEDNQTCLNDDFKKILRSKIAVFSSGLPDCTDDEVLVEYHSSVHKLKFYEGSLLMTRDDSLKPQVFPQSSFCIERTKNSIDLSDELNGHLKASSKWIAKVCQAKIVCKKIPCVSKCCKEGQRMTFDDKTLCEKHSSHLHLKFHSFNIETEIRHPNITEPLGKDLRIFDVFKVKI